MMKYELYQCQKFLADYAFKHRLAMCLNTVFIDKMTIMMTIYNVEGGQVVALIWSFCPLGFDNLVTVPIERENIVNVPMSILAPLLCLASPKNEQSRHGVPKRPNI